MSDRIRIEPWIEHDGRLELAATLDLGGNTSITINIIYENELDFNTRKALYDESITGENSRQFNFGGYSPPMSITEGDDFPND